VALGLRGKAAAGSNRILPICVSLRGFSCRACGMGMIRGSELTMLSSRMGRWNWLEANRAIFCFLPGNSGGKVKAGGVRETEPETVS